MQYNPFTNPFGGLLDREIEQFIVPKFTIDEIESAFFHSNYDIIELKGKKGRGKTMHLKWLNSKLQNAHYLRITAETTLTQVLNIPRPILLLDEIQHLSWKDKIHLFRSNKKVIYSCHHCLLWTKLIPNTKKKQISFHASSPSEIQCIIEKRIFSINPSIQQRKKKSSAFDYNKLHAKYKDDYRSLIQSFYKEYENNEKR